MMKRDTASHAEWPPATLGLSCEQIDKRCLTAPKLGSTVYLLTQEVVRLYPRIRWDKSDHFSFSYPDLSTLASS